ncbi:MAG: ThuA domain-containing protein, partial [Planctomycetes bacterium]|nr:ThuA domain-containing protein [Planctomycetota bacterium]
MRATFSRPMAVALSLAVMLAAILACEAAAAPVRVLVLSGCNNHDWKTTTPALVKILEEGGRFKVDVIEDPAVMDAAMLARYDVIVSNWSGFPEMDGRQWGEKAEKAFLDFIGGGKGFVLFHAASATLHTWPEFQQLAGATWGKDTGHGRVHAFKVKVTDAAHPITRGLKEFVITDELWHRMQAHPDRHVLCAAVSSKDEGGSGQDEPVVFTTQLGKGRGLNIVLGHDTSTMQNVAWQALMRRATEWAATGAVTIPIPAAWPAAPAGGAAAADVDAALAKIAGYTFGKSRADLGPVEQLTYAAASDPALRATLAAALTKRLASDATLDCKRFLCDQLGLIGSDAEVPALAAFLANNDLATAARSALARIPGEAALAAMRAAAGKTSGLVLVGLINTLGDRRDAKAVEAIAGRLADADAVVAAAAIDALGK